MNVESKVREPTSLAMIELAPRLRMLFATREPIECFFKVLDGVATLALGSRPK